MARNVPDTILRRIGKLSKKSSRHCHRSQVKANEIDLSLDGEKGQGWGNDTNEIDLPIPSGDAIIMLNFAPFFISEGFDGSGQNATTALLADHADYIGRLAGREHVGIGR